MVGRSSVVFGLVGLLTACGASRDQLRTRAAFDLDCPEASVEVIPLDRSTYGVRGCGQKATYVEVCNGQPGYAGTRCTWTLDAASGAPARPPPGAPAAPRASLPPSPRTPTRPTVPAVQVKIRGDEPGLRFAIYPWTDPEAARRPAFACAAPCDAKLVPGTYRLSVEGPPESDVRTSSRRVSIDGPVVLDVDPPSAFYRGAGLTSGIVGAVTMAVGIGILARAEPTAGDARNDDHLRGAAVFGAGAVLTGVGWTMFGVNGSPAIERRAATGHP